MPTSNRKVSGKPRKKATALETAGRVEEILCLRLEGVKFRGIVDHGAKKGWGVNERQIRTYIKRADELIKEEMKGGRKDAIAWHLARLEMLYAKALRAGDLRAALSTLEDNAKMRDLYPDRNLKELFRITKEQDKQIAELERRFNAAADHKEP